MQQQPNGIPTQLLLVCTVVRAHSTSGQLQPRWALSHEGKRDCKVLYRGWCALVCAIVCVNDVVARRLLGTTRAATWQLITTTIMVHFASQQRTLCPRTHTALCIRVPSTPQGRAAHCALESQRNHNPPLPSVMHQRPPCVLWVVSILPRRGRTREDEEQAFKPALSHNVDKTRCAFCINYSTCATQQPIINSQPCVIIKWFGRPSRP